jgi:hypothetical protein
MYKPEPAATYTLKYVKVFDIILGIAITFAGITPRALDKTILPIGKVIHRTRDNLR